ncbi:DNA (cytosine-5)-methyltransferase DRM2 [Dorcoceras hygrometricum]|uniref:DNA (Cytosine-5)-methyltransferase DRM2 n=1 Tax=Dorcoceras hygrometricum TaxID=472368 RepID=A0A2Z7BUM7_9LAMI|nr:DNA (cytosine-5)-methyltransferase DRM2 [Dorcoceras hygrometricum]
MDLKNRSVKPSTVELGEADSLQTELSKLKAENDSLRLSSCELEAENERLNEVMSSWTMYFVSLSKLHEAQKPLNDKSGLGFNNGESSAEETSTQSNLVYDKFKKMSFVKASMIHDSYESVRYDDQISGQKPLNDKSGLGFNNSESSAGETSTQSNLVYDKFKKMSFVKASTIHDSYESVKSDLHMWSSMKQVLDPTQLRA